MAAKMFLLFLASFLALARSATVAPQGDGAEKPPPPSIDDILQREISLGDFPVDLEQTMVDSFDDDLFPLLVHGEPQPAPLSPLGPRGRKPSCPSGRRCSRPVPRYRLDEFPPARPSQANIGNICAEGRKKLSYGPWNLPQTSFSHLVRQGEALNHLETGLGQCCQLNEEERLPCCRSTWEQALSQYCKEEFRVKTRPHWCCKKPEGELRFACFAAEAPYPSYEREVETISLAAITAPLLASFCGDFILLTKQRNIPSLVQNITDSCCKLEGNERIQCAEEQKTQFIATLCSNQKRSWKDPKKCCALSEGKARDDCFDQNYLNNISLASAV